MSVMNNFGKIDTYAVIAPGEVIFSLFSLPTPRFARPGVFRRASKPMRDWENEPESTLAFFPGTKGDSSAITVFGFTGRCCSACGIRTGAAEAGTADVLVMETSGRTVEGDKDILTARCGCG